MYVKGRLHEAFWELPLPFVSEWSAKAYICRGYHHQMWTNKHTSKPKQKNQTNKQKPKQTRQRHFSLCHHHYKITAILFVELSDSKIEILIGKRMIAFGELAISLSSLHKDVNATSFSKCLRPLKYFVSESWHMVLDCLLFKTWKQQFGVLYIWINCCKITVFKSFFGSYVFLDVFFVPPPLILQRQPVELGKSSKYASTMTRPHQSLYIK